MYFIAYESSNFMQCRRRSVSRIVYQNHVFFFHHCLDVVWEILTVYVVCRCVERLISRTTFCLGGDQESAFVNFHFFVLDSSAVVCR